MRVVQPGGAVGVGQSTSMISTTVGSRPRCRRAPPARSARAAGPGGARRPGHRGGGGGGRPRRPGRAGRERGRGPGSSRSDVVAVGIGGRGGRVGERGGHGGLLGCEGRRGMRRAGGERSKGVGRTGERSGRVHADGGGPRRVADREHGLGSPLAGGDPASAVDLDRQAVGVTEVQRPGGAERADLAVGGAGRGDPLAERLEIGQPGQLEAEVVDATAAARSRCLSRRPGGRSRAPRTRGGSRRRRGGRWRVGSTGQRPSGGARPGGGRRRPRGSGGSGRCRSV